MMNLILQQLDRLQSDLLAIKPTHDLAAADQVADMAKRLRDTLAGPGVSGGHLSRRLNQLREIDKMAGRAA